jgi:hypothetical protein
MATFACMKSNLFGRNCALSATRTTTGSLLRTSISLSSLSLNANRVTSQATETALWQFLQSGGKG